MKNKVGLLLILILTLVLAGCQPATPAPATEGPAGDAVSAEPTAAPATKASEENDSALPVIQSSEQTPYPAAQGEYPAPGVAYPGPAEVFSLTSTYPGPGQQQAAGEQVAWEKAAEAIAAGEVTQAYQNNLNQVTLVLKDGRILYTIQPGADDVFKALDSCGDPCKDVQRVTE